MSTAQIDSGLLRYYSNKNVSYTDEDGNGLFMEWCDVNGYDTEGIEEELEQDPSDCALIEFDEDFPTNKFGEERLMEILNVIKHCYENENASSNGSCIF